MLGCEYSEVLTNVWPKMGFGTELLEQCNLFKAKEFFGVWVVLLSAKSGEGSVSTLLSSEEFVEVEVGRGGVEELDRSRREELDFTEAVNSFIRVM